MRDFLTIDLKGEHRRTAAEGAPFAQSKTDPFRYAFLGLLALNVFLLSGAASFAAALYFWR